MLPRQERRGPAASGDRFCAHLPRPSAEVGVLRPRAHSRAIASMLPLIQAQLSMQLQRAWQGIGDACFVRSATAVRSDGASSVWHGRP